MEERPYLNPHRDKEIERGKSSNLDWNDPPSEMRQWQLEFDKRVGRHHWILPPYVDVPQVKKAALTDHDNAKAQKIASVPSLQLLAMQSVDHQIMEEHRPRPVQLPYLSQVDNGVPWVDSDFFSHPMPQEPEQPFPTPIGYFTGRQGWWLNARQTDTANESEMWTAWW